ncbi:MAG: DegV family protein [Anaerolineales bacterium]|nr:DegV family protein [Anaerolineales bacterium]
MTATIGFVTDSTSDIPAEDAAKYSVEVVPAMIMFGGQSYRDGVDISRSDLYRRMTTQRILPTTASPSVGAFEEAFEKVLARGVDKVLSIHLASSLSGIFNSAFIAAKRFPGRVEVVETGQVSMGTGFLILDAAEAAAKGAPIDALKKLVADTRKRMQLVALLESLTHLAHSGRIPMVLAGIGNFLQIKVLISLYEGTVNRIGQARTQSRGITALLEHVRSWGPVERLAVAHADARHVADGLLPQLEENLQGFNSALRQKTYVIEVTPAIGVHIGPGAVGVIAMQAPSGA